MQGEIGTAKINGTNNTVRTFTGTGAENNAYTYNMMLGQGVPLAHVDWKGEEYQVNVSFAGMFFVILTIMFWGMFRWR